MMEHRVWAEIDLDALKNNYRKISAFAAPLEAFAVVKANAYNLGVVPVARALKDAGAKRFCIAVPEEALPLEQFGLPIQILGGLLPEEIPFVLEHNIEVGVADSVTAERLNEAAGRMGKKAVCHLKLDTGMGRMGFLTEGHEEEILHVLSLPNLKFVGLYSHFPRGDKPEDPVTRKQLSRFRRMADFLKDHGITFPMIHFASSDAIRCCADARKAPFNGVRPGLSLYGFDSCSSPELPLTPVVSLKSRIIAVRKMPAGSTISYNCTRVLEKDTLVGTVSAGYADGIPLALTNRGSVLVRGVRCPILGRVCMDYFVISLDSFSPEEISAGETVTIFGEDHGVRLPVEEVAGLKNTHPWDILCSIGPRVKRVYVEKQ